MLISEMFTWMLKKEDFKNHIFKLFNILFIFFILLMLIALCLNLLRNTASPQLLIGLKFTFAVIMLLPFLFITGYFWSLTENIINRDVDITANSIYNNKLKQKFIINFPEWNIIKFLWRGLASIIATIIMYIPYILILGNSNSQLANTAAFWGWDSAQTTIITNSLFIISCILVPGLLWNYARQDSIVATLNIPKAFYLITTYPFRYLTHSLFLVFIYLLYAKIMDFLTTIINFSKYPDYRIDEYVIYVMSYSATDIFFKIVLLLFGCYIISLFFLYVYAYILGTLTPSNEN